MTVLDDLPLPELERLAIRSAEEIAPEYWLTRVFPTYVGATGTESVTEAEELFADHHRRFWAWCWAVRSGIRPDPFVGVWARGGAKSTSAELGAAALGALYRRRYGLYVCATQEQADDHVGNVAAMLESDTVARWYPGMADRLIGKFGNSKGWRRNRIRAASGFTLDAIGLDTAARGVKLEDQRPDLLIVDDIDHHDDSPAMVAKKIDTLTKALLPAGSEDMAVLAIQNLVHRDGVFARLVNGRARFLARRIVSGPIPAVRNLVTRHEATVDEHGNPVGRDVVVSGDPTWRGQPLERVQSQIDDWGLPAFLAEAQHSVHRVEGALWTPEQLAVVRRGPDDFDTMATIVVAIDPSGGDGPDNDAQGIVVAGADATGIGWVLDDLTCALPPAGWGDRALQAFEDWQADRFVCETNFGGDMVVEVLRGAIERASLERRMGPVRSMTTKNTPNGKTVTITVDRRPPFVVHVVHASRGKRARAEPVAALYGRPDDEATWSTARVHHAGQFPALEDEMTSWRPDASWSPNRMDAMVWALTDLCVDTKPRGRRRSIVGSS